MYGKSKTKKYSTKNKRVYKKRNYIKNRTSITKVVQKVLNSQQEKKRIDVTLFNTDVTMGQCAGNGNAFYASYVTPTPAQGSGASNRTGSEINITSAYITVQLRQMSAAVAPTVVQFYLVRTKGEYSQTATDFVVNAISPNNFIGTGVNIIDTNSQWNPDFFGTYSIIKKWKMYIKPDGFSGQQMPAMRNIPLKFKKPLVQRFLTSSTNSNNKMILIALASNGNASTAVASTLANVPVAAINTGLFINFDIRWYYTDA